MVRSHALSEAPLGARAPHGSRADNPLVRAVGRVPVKVRTKLLVAFAVIAALLVAIAALGVRVLGQADSRIESLGTLQQGERKCNNCNNSIKLYTDSTCIDTYRWKCTATVTSRTKAK